MSDIGVSARPRIAERSAAWIVDFLPAAICVALVQSALGFGSSALVREGIDGLSRDLLEQLLQDVDAGEPLLSAALAISVDPAIHASATAFAVSVTVLLFKLVALYFVAAALWQLPVAIRTGATLGQRLFGLSMRETADQSGRPPRASALILRFVTAGISWLTLNIGHAMVFLPPQYQTLHDRIAGIEVTGRDAPRNRQRARMTLWLAGAVGLAAVIWLARGLVAIAEHAVLNPLR